MAELLDRRIALEEAFDSAEADAKGETYTPPIREQPAEEKQQVVVEPTVEDPIDVEVEAAKPQKERQRTKGVPLDERTKPALTEEQRAVDPVVEKAAGKAPLGWGPARDTLWAKTPVEVRSAINKRELEIQQGMSQAGRIRQVAEEYHQVIAPFEGTIRSIGTTPKEALTSVMQTATVMIIGTQAQKCAVLSEMVQRYGVDVQEFDRVLTASLKGQGPNSNPQQYQQIDPRILQQLQPLIALQQRVAEADGQKTQRMETEAAEAINSVVDKPYFEDLRQDMADIMEIAAKRGRVMSIDEAYSKAAELSPEISKLLPRATPKNNTTIVARARKASATVSGNPGGPVTGASSDRRSQIEEAWNSQ